jgi:F-type H+-transporting ATPase subunit delta
MDRSIVNTWAAGILSHARGTGTQTRWSTTLSMLDKMVSNQHFARAAFQTGLSRNDLFSLVCQLCAEFLSQEEKNLLRLLTDHGRLRLIGRIRRRYEELRDQEAGIVHVMTITAVPLDPQSWETLLPSLVHHFGPGMRPHFHSDPELMGGVIIRSGDQVLDVSARGRLDRLARVLNS